MVRGPDTDIRRLPAEELPAELVATWERLRERVGWDSPFFAPGFARTVAAVRPGIEIAVLSSAGCAAGFLAYCRGADRVARAVAGTFSDFQGAAIDADLVWGPAELLRACDLRALCFEHVPAIQHALAPYAWSRQDAPFLELSHGFEPYDRVGHGAAVDELRETRRKERKLRRDIGPPRFELAVRDEHVLSQLIDWKQEQLRRRRWFDPFSAPWSRPMLVAFHRRTAADCAGVLSALYAGENLAAASFGLRSGNVLHGWLMAYDVRFARYSPGRILLAHLLRAAAEAGIRRLDMGGGDERYKRLLASGVTPLIGGACDHRRLAGWWNRSWGRAKNWVRHSRWREPARRWSGAWQRVRGFWGSGRIPSIESSDHV